MRSRSISRALVLLAALYSFSPAAEPPAPARTKEVAIREFLALTGAGKLGIQVMNQLVPDLKKIAPDIGEDFWERFMPSVKPEELIDIIVPVYAKHFSLDEMEQIIAFFKSPIGQKYVQELPSLVQDSMQAGQAWGQMLGRRAMKAIEAERAKEKKAQ